MNYASPIVYGKQLQRLIDSTGHTVEELATKIKRPPWWVRDMLDFAALPESEHELFRISILGITGRETAQEALLWLYNYQACQRIMRT